MHSTYRMKLHSEKFDPKNDNIYVFESATDMKPSIINTKSSITFNQTLLYDSTT